MSNERLRLLQRMPVFGGIHEENLRFLINLAPTATVPPGEYFFREHQKGGTMYVLENGRVAVFRTVEERAYLLAYLGKGDCFGEMEMIDPHPRVASVMAVTTSTAIQISNTSLLSLYKRDHEQFTLIQMNMSREISRRLRRMDEEIFRYRQNSNPEENLFLSPHEILERGSVKKKGATS